MSDSKKPTVSEIKARYKTARSRQRGFLTADYFYLLDLVSRLGKVLKEFGVLSALAKTGAFCDQCHVTVEPDGKVTHEASCPIPEARALLKELEL
jgi:hypothetical protein